MSQERGSRATAESYGHALLPADPVPKALLVAL
jgi:hypothetical protein